MNFGKNVRLTRQDLETALKTHAHRVGQSRGSIPLHSDVFDFIERTTVHWNLRPLAQQVPTDPAAEVVDVYVTVDE